MVVLSLQLAASKPCLLTISATYNHSVLGALVRPAAKHFSAMLFSSSSWIEFSTALHAKDRALLSLLMHRCPALSSNPVKPTWRRQ